MAGVRAKQVDGVLVAEAPAPPEAPLLAGRQGVPLGLEGGTVGVVVLAAVVVGSALTVAYGLRLWWGAFATKPALVPQSKTQDSDGVATTTSLAAGGDESVEPAPVTRPSFLLTAPALVLAFLGLAVAVLPYRL